MISWLASDYFAQSPVLALPVIALLVFMAVFTAMAIKAWRLSDGEIAELSMKPLGDDARPQPDTTEAQNV